MSHNKPSLGASLAATVDRLVARGLTGRSARARRNSRAESLGHEARLEALTSVAERYESAEPLEDVARFFGHAEPASPALSPLGSRPSRHGAIDVTDASWPSRTSTFASELETRFCQASRENLRAHARLFLGRDPQRPAVILVHGYRAGNPAFEERVWPLQWLLDHGLDVALFVLPFHGRRAAPGKGSLFPAADPRFTIEGFRQAIFDLSALTRFFRERGAPHVGAMGMSLGGYTVSLLGTVEELDFLAPVIPLASFADVAREAGRLVGSPAEQALQHQALENAYRTVSPFARPPRVAPGATVVVAGQSDGITPIAHAVRIANHFGSELVTFPGGHLLQFGRAEGFRAIGKMLRERQIFRS